MQETIHITIERSGLSDGEKGQIKAALLKAAESGHMHLEEIADQLLRAFRCVDAA